MKKIFSIIIILIFQLNINAQHPSTDPNYEMIFEDNFDTYDASKWWKMDAGWGCTPANNTFVGGKALLTNELINSTVRPPITTQGGLMTIARFYPGSYLECSAKIPRGIHPWSSFWLWEGRGNCTSVYDYREIDILEWIGLYNTSTANLHYCEEGFIPDTLAFRGTNINYNIQEPYIYNTYACMWDKSLITHLLNNNIVKTNTPPNRMFNSNMAILLGNGNGFDVNNDRKIDTNDIVDISNFPHTFEVDYVRVYRLKQNCNTIINEIPNFSTYVYSLKKAIYMSSATTIPTTSSISLRAVDEIELRDGFEVPNNTTFYLNTNECY